MTILSAQPPEARQSALLRLINGFQISQAIHVVVELGIPELLGDGALPADVLAVRTGSHPRALHRVLLALAAVEVLAETDAGFSLTALGRPLRNDCACSRNAWARFALRPAHWQAWGAMLHTVRTGENAFRAIHGTDVWTYRAAHPEEGARFDAAMQERSACFARTLPDCFDFSHFQADCRCRWRHWHFACRAAAAMPDSTGHALRPACGEGASRVLAAAGVTARCTIVAGDVFEAVPIC